MAQLNFPDPNSVQVYEAGGLKWTWNTTHQVWSAELSGDDFLSKVNDDTAAGVITFEKESIHEGGINTQFIDVDNSSLNIRRDSSKIVSFGVNSASSATAANIVLRDLMPLVPTGDDIGISAYNVNTDQGDYSSLSTVRGYSFQFPRSNGITVDPTSEIIGYQARPAASNINENNTSITYYGFKSELTQSQNYNFYADGTAPNYFAGTIKAASDPDATVGWNGTGVGVSIGAPIGNLALARSGSGATGNHCLILKRMDPAATANWGVIRMGNSDGTIETVIKLSGSTFRSVDTRLGATGVAMADGAADIVKLLQPKVITQGGETFSGFLPADLAGTFAAAVDGEAGATTAIGTYTDPDGVVETEVEEPEAIPFGATWVQTGTRDDMQSVCREELIPLLTKALQETIAKNEELEARLAALEGGTN